MQTCTEHQKGKFRPKIAFFFSRCFTTKLDFCYLNFSKNIQLFKNLFVSYGKVSLFVSIKLVSLFHEVHPDGSWGLSLKRGGGGGGGGDVFRQSGKYNMFDQIFFSNWYSDLYQKWQYIGIFHPLRIILYLKLRGQSMRFCTASQSPGTYEKFEFLVCFLFTAIFFEMISLHQF